MNKYENNIQAGIATSDGGGKMQKLKIGYIFSKFESFTQIKKAKIKSIFNRPIRPYGI